MSRPIYGVAKQEKSKDDPEAYVDVNKAKQHITTRFDHFQEKEIMKLGHQIVKLAGKEYIIKIETNIHFARDHTLAKL